MTVKELVHRWILSLAPPLGARSLRALAATWRVAEAGRTALSPAAAQKQPKIYALWHESALACAYYRDIPLHALASQSFDGELITRTLLKLGYAQPARGSSTRGGVGGLLELQSFLAQDESVLLTVDGPKGPRRRAKNGVVKLAQLSGRPVVPIAFACAPQPRLLSWDRMVVPPPLTKGVIWYGEELHFTPARKRALGDPELARLQAAMELCDASAQAWIGQGGRESLSRN